MKSEMEQTDKKENLGNADAAASDQKRADSEATTSSSKPEPREEHDPLRAAEERAEAAEKKVAEYLEMAQRIKADYENYRKRMLKEQTLHLEHAARRVVESLLPVLDAFELALSSLDQIRGTHDNIAKGIEMVYAELIATLAKEGLFRIDEAGVPFDPHIHHALEREGIRREGDEEYVAAVIRPGYKLKSQVLRPAEVRVGYRTTPPDSASET
ncbi:MAG: nucleotide exchange factor GrpE [Acidimicrobiia bacterium]